MKPVQEGAGSCRMCVSAGKKLQNTVSKAGIRVVNVRFGVVLSKNGGALAKMLTPFKMGMGGKIGSGTQYMSWVAIDDVTGAIYHALVTDSLKGPVNVTAPNPVTNKEFTNIRLGKVLNSANHNANACLCGQARIW